MSALVDAIFRVGNAVGWDFLLLLAFLYELFWPRRLWQTRLRKEMNSPSKGVVAALKAIYEQDENLSTEKLVENLNGDIPHSWDFREGELK